MELSHEILMYLLLILRFLLLLMVSLLNIFFSRRKDIDLLMMEKFGRQHKQTLI